MQTLCLYIENGIDIDINVQCILNISRKDFLALHLHIHKFLLQILVIYILHKILQTLRVCFKIRTNRLFQQVAQLRVGVQQPSSVCDTVCFVVEFIRIDVMEVLHNILFQNFRMQCSYTVDTVRADDCQVCHVNLSVLQHAALIHQIRSAHIMTYLIFEATIDFLDNHEYARQQILYILNRPFFQSLAQDSMICICHGILCNIPSLIPVIFIIIHKNTHQLRYTEYRMGIVQLNRNLFREVIQCMIGRHVRFDNIIQSCGYEEILLLQTQNLAMLGGIIRINIAADFTHLVYIFVQTARITGIIRNLCTPQTKCICQVGVLSDNRHVIRYGAYNQGRHMVNDCLAVFSHPHVHMSAKVDIDCMLRFPDFPDIA